jgi:predicted NUDIX family phosphoesterase
MTITTQSQAQTPTTHHDEHIMVVKRDTLFGLKPAWHGIESESLESYITLIKNEHEFLPRFLMEEDARYKQIIPYIVFTFNNQYFLMQRQAHATEQRLKSKMSLGIGGHLRAEDITDGDLFGWAKREFHEEVAYMGDMSIRVIGLLNDDTNPVGQVHLGVVMLVEGTNPHIAVKSELKSGKLATLEECRMEYDRLESWSQIVLDSLS